MSEILAAVDCGTNSIRLLLSRYEGGKLTELDRRLFLTRLGEGVDATGEFSTPGLERTFAALDDFAEEIDAAGGTKIRVVATSAARDANNSEVFYAGVRARLGVNPEIIAGEEEARLSYLGAVRALPNLPAPVLVMDIGGGSTELVTGSGNEVYQAVSLDIGGVRVRERFFANEVPSKEEILAAREYVDDLITSSDIDFDEIYSFVGVGGTVTSLAALVQELPHYDRERVHEYVISQSDLRHLVGRLLSSTTEEILALPTMQAGRADVISAGGVIAREVSRVVGLPLTVCEADLLDGIVAELALGK
ncbi:MAG: Ppx/GppA family phosphatase [Propionibacteriaceae bacterium]|jgi:exopolyphosphatase/guanosine-5'-triphosphate,3'-diphosphate pyrophosphatase|nr:Ppx/GppA family phosphatase [Propionibacteriaceae bacterium]